MELNFDTGQVNIVDGNTYSVAYNLSDYPSSDYMILGMYAVGYLEFYGAYIVSAPYLGRRGTAKLRAYTESGPGTYPNGAIGIRLVLLKKS